MTSNVTVLPSGDNSFCPSRFVPCHLRAIHCPPSGQTPFLPVPPGPSTLPRDSQPTLAALPTPHAPDLFPTACGLAGLRPTQPPLPNAARRLLWPGRHITP